MNLNSFKVALRNLAKQKGYTAINIIGLAIGIASALLIALYVYEETTYDKFHPNHERLYRVYLKSRMMGTEMSGAVSCAPVGPTIIKEYADVENFCRTFNFGGDQLVRNGDKTFIAKRAIFADSTFFKVFNGFKLLTGDPQKALSKPNSLVLTQSASKKYFGNSDPVGLTVEVGNDRQKWVITGVMEDVPNSSHFHFDFLLSMVSIPNLADGTFWISNNNYTYLLLKPDADPKVINQHLTELVEKYAYPQAEQFFGTLSSNLEESGSTYGYYTQKVTDIHLKSELQYEFEAGGSEVMVYVFVIIAVFILIIAAINFMNLATARSTKRAKEVGIRKVVGSTRGRIIAQFLVESTLLALISTAIALILVKLALPSFSNLAERTITMNSLPLSATVLILMGIILIIGLAAGSYPAFYLSKFEPVKVLKGKVKSGMKNSWTRGILVVFQFTISIGLLVSTFVVYKQVSFFKDKDLGFKKENILVINRPYAVPRASRESFLNALKEIPSVKEVTATNGLPSTVIGGTGFVPKGSPGNETSIFNFIFTDWDFAKTFELELTDGRYFSRDFASDSAALVLNQAAVKALGLQDPVIGSHIIYNGDNEAVVVGVVKDFNFESLHKSISPLVLCFANTFTYVAVKIDDNDINTTVANIKSKWNEFVPEQEFDYTFLDQMLDNQYGNEKRTGLIFSSFSILAIIIASLGLLGLASYTTEQRTKEIGIRKVVGASTLKVISILIKEVNMLFIIATAIAWPLAWYLMSTWLQNFANKVALSLTEFIIASAITYIIAIITIGYQAIKAANTNPANTLKYE